MIKKISAIVLALVLCLSVVVVPASAYTLGANSEVAYVIELDKANYSAGDVATVKVFLYGKSGLEFGTGAVVIGMNSSVFDMADNAIDDVKASAVGSDAMESYYKAANGLSWAWQTNATVLSNIEANNTAEENAMFDQYIKFTLARNTSGTHDNAGSNKNGLPADEINADSANGVPFLTFQLVVKADVADGTAINVGVPTGAMPKNYTYMNYYKTPGTATTVVKTTAATTEIVNSTTATIGAAYPDFTIAEGKDAIRFEKNADESYANKVTIRTMAKINAATLQTAVGATANDDVEKYIVEAGFVYAPSTTTFDVAEAQKEAQGTDVAGYYKKAVSYIQNDGTDYNYTCLIEVQDADVATANFNTYAYIALDFDMDGTADKYYFYAAQNAISAQTLYNANNDAAWAKYGWGTATDK